MKTVKMNWKSNNSPFNNWMMALSSPCFFWFGSKKDGAYQHATCWHSCRETFSNEIRRHLGVPGFNQFNYTMDMRRLRVGVIRVLGKYISKTDYETQLAMDDLGMKEGIRMLNIVEKYLGWSLSSVSKIHDDFEGKSLRKHNIHAYAVLGSAKWLRSPQLLSLYLLILRAGAGFEITHDVVKTIDDFAKLYEKAKEKRMSSRVKNDISRFFYIGPKLKLILDNVDKLFLCRPASVSYELNSSKNGITEFVHGRADKKTATKWREIKASANK